MAVLGVLLDLLVLICLGVTIYYARRLSVSLNVFRQTRKEFDGVMRQLSKNIDDAYEAVEGLKKATRDSGVNLQKSLTDSRAIATDLDILIQAANKAAQKLENANQSGRGGHQATYEEDDGAFAIFDREIEDEETSIDDVGHESPMPSGNFQSQAERELFEALQKTQKSPGRGRI